MTVPTKMPPIQYSTMRHHIYANLPLLILNSFLIPLYKVTHMIVTEKSNKVRESLRMCGLGQTAYWLSWFVYFTWVNTLVCLVLFTGLMGFVFDRTSGFIFFVFIWIYGECLFGFVMIT